MLLTFYGMYSRNVQNLESMILIINETVRRTMTNNCTPTPTHTHTHPHTQTPYDQFSFTFYYAVYNYYDHSILYILCW